MPTGCSPTAAAATARCRRSASTRSSSSWRSRVDRVMAEGSLYDQELAALAIVQARGDLIEAIFLVRAYRTTLPRFGYSRPSIRRRCRSSGACRRPSRTCPAASCSGPTFDYTHRLLDLELAGGARRRRAAAARSAATAAMPRVPDILGREGLIEPDGELPSDEPGDLTREPLEFPMARDVRLQALARGDEGFLLALGYSTQRGYGAHPSLRRRDPHRRGRGRDRVAGTRLSPSTLGGIRVTECQMVNQFKGSAKAPPQFTRGYGLVFGQSERKAMAMALCDRAMRAEELGEDVDRAGAERGIRHLPFRQCRRRPASSSI